jgi:hypothetical protein
MGVWQWVAMDSLKFTRACHALLQYYTLGESHPLKSYGRGGPPIGQEAFDRRLPLWTPHAVRLCLSPFGHPPDPEIHPKEEEASGTRLSKSLSERRL